MRASGACIAEVWECSYGCQSLASGESSDGWKPRKRPNWLPVRLAPVPDIADIPSLSLTSLSVLSTLRPGPCHSRRCGALHSCFFHFFNSSVGSSVLNTPKDVSRTKKRTSIARRGRTTTLEWPPSDLHLDAKVSIAFIITLCS